MLEVSRHKKIAMPEAFIQNLADNMQPLPDDAAQVLNDNFWDWYEPIEPPQREDERSTKPLQERG